MNDQPAPSTLTTTQKLWRPISELQAEREKIGKELRSAAVQGDLDAAMAAAKRMGELEIEMAQAATAVREHARTKALAKSQPDKTNYPAIGQMLLHAWEWGIQNGVIQVPGVSTATDAEQSHE